MILSSILIRFHHDGPQYAHAHGLFPYLSPYGRATLIILSVQPSPPDLSSAQDTPTPGTSTVVTPSIVLPAELRPLTAKDAVVDSGRSSATPDAKDPLNLDLSLPLSALLRESTKIAHTQAEHSAGAIALAGGTLPFREYVRYLASLWIVYSALEREISRHSTSSETEQESDVLGSLWSEAKGGKGRMLSRSEALAKDVEYLVSLKPASEWTIDPRDETPPSASSLPTPSFHLPPFLQPLFTSPPPAITSFVQHLERISSTRPALLLAHAYVRYLGDLSGGQIVRSRIRRVYALDPHSSDASESSQDGTQFYEFDIFDSADRPVDGGEVKQPTMYERKQRMTDIKEWFRSVLDSGTADGKEELKSESSRCARFRPRPDTSLLQVHWSTKPSNPSTSLRTSSPRSAPRHQWTISPTLQ